MTQTELIREHLEKGRSLTPLEAARYSLASGKIGLFAA